MKRFLLFIGPEYYPSGGFSDFNSEHETQESAVALGQKKVVEESAYYGWWHVVDLSNGLIVAFGSDEKPLEFPPT